MLVRSSDSEEIATPEDALVMRKLLTAAHGDDLSITHVRLDGVHRPLRTLRSTRVYYVLEGAGRFTVGDEPPVVADAGDVVVVPRGVAYGFEGTLTYLVLNTPAFVEGDDIYVDA
jgi:mannose-6-phosphate isomerase-like protein (cupin superfamily)